MSILAALEQQRANAKHSVRLASKALRQWVDQPDGSVSSALFVVGEPTTAWTPLIESLQHTDGLWVHTPASAIAFDADRLRSPASIALLTRLTPAGVVIYAASHEGHLADRLLDVHDTARVLWVYERFEAAVERALDASEPQSALQTLRNIAEAREHDAGWQGERLPDDLIADLRDIIHDDLTAADAAALLWWMRHSFFFSLQLETNPRVAITPAARLCQSADAEDVFAWIGCADAAPHMGTSPMTDLLHDAPPPALDPRVSQRCAALQSRLDDAVATSGVAARLP